MLYPIKPFSFVVTAVIPVHFSEIASEILFVVSFIDVAACPCKDTVSVFFILNILALVFVAVSRTFFPHPVSFSQSVPETSLEITAIGPIIFSISVGFPLAILSLVQISICKLFGPLAVLKAGFEVAFITIAVYPNVNSIAFRFSHSPFADVTVSFNAAPHSGAVFESVYPLSFIGLALSPRVFPDSFGFSIYVLTLVCAAIGKHLEACALLVVAFPMSFVDSIVVIDHNSKSVTTTIHDFSIVCGLSVLFEFEVLRDFQFVEVDNVRSRHIFLELFNKVLERGLTNH
jgi:hypothetical protein